jgi:hypothetical protein
MFAFCMAAFLSNLQLLFGQSSSQPGGETAQVPFVGCASDGQLGPVKAPEGNAKSVVVSLGAARRLAYYEAEDGIGVLAPRGWHCFGAYGSNGATLYIAPDPISSSDLLSQDQKGFAGPAIQVSYMSGDTCRTICSGPNHRSRVPDS